MIRLKSGILCTVFHEVFLSWSWYKNSLYNFVIILMFDFESVLTGVYLFVHLIFIHMPGDP